MSSDSSASKWLSQFAEDLQDGRGVAGATARAAYYGYLGLWHTVTSRYPIGTNVFDREWDALILLDSCRVDALRSVAGEYDFLGPVESTRSVGSTSHEWVAKTFTREHRAEIGRTGYVTANGYLYMTADEGRHPPSGGVAPLGWPRWDVVDVDEFAFTDYVWRDGGEVDLSTVPPHAVTDRAVAAGRERDHERLVVHYMQPHGPFIADAVRDRELGPDPADHVVSFREMIKGDTDREVVRERYLANLRLVLDEVGLLLSNLDADRVVISADHGELLGEFGLAGHPDGFPIAPVKRVPWARASATDTGAHRPTVEPDDAEASVEDHLRDLGYVV
jgi:hypothetical protein